MSVLPLAASRRPTFVASTRSSTTTSVLSWRTSRESRACRSGWRIAWASAVAGTVTRAPVSCTRASNTNIRRSLRSTAIRPPASRVIPATRRQNSPGGWQHQGRCPPNFVPRETVLPRCRGERRPAWRPTRRRRRGRHPPRAERSPTHLTQLLGSQQRVCARVGSHRA